MIYRSAWHSQRFVLPQYASIPLAVSIVSTFPRVWLSVAPACKTTTSPDCEQLSWRRLFDGSFGPSDYERRYMRHCKGVYKNVLNAYRVGKAIGNYQLSKQMLSLAVVRGHGVLYQREVASEATRRRELRLLDEVRVLHTTKTSASRRSWRDAVLVAVRPDDGRLCVMPKVVGARGRLTVDVDFVSSAAATDDSAGGDGGASSSVATDDASLIVPGGDDDLPTLDALPYDPDEYRQPLYSTTGDVGSLPVCGFVAPASDVRHCDDPYCTRYAVKEASKHGLALYPGAPAPSIKNDLPRTVGENAESCATFWRSADAVARPDGGMNTAKKGTKYLFKEKPAALLRNLNKLRAASGIKPFPPKYFYGLVGTRCVTPRSPSPSS